MKLESFLNIEKKYDLYKKQEKGVNYWVYCRSVMFNQDIERQISKLHSLDGSSGSRLRLLLYVAASRILTRCHIRKSRILFVNYSKNNVITDGNIQRKYIQDLYAAYPDSLILEDSVRGYKPGKKDNRNIIYQNHLKFRGMLGLSLTRFFHHSAYESSKERIKEQISPAFEEIKEAYQWNGNISDWVEKMAAVVYKHNFIYKSYERLIRKIDPAVIVMITQGAIDRRIIIEIAKDREIPVVEIQHGVIFDDHLTYHYLSDDPIKQFPDKILMFSEFWRNKIMAPISAEDLVPVGFPYFEDTIHLYQGKKRTDDKYTILFVSQWTIAEELSKFAVELRKLLPEDSFRIIYKHHQRDTKRWETKYPWLKDSGIDIITDQKSIYELFSESDMQIGVYSTAIYEGLGFNLPTLIVKVGLYLTMEEVVNQGYASFVDKAEEARNIIFSKPAGNNGRGSDFWEKNSKEKMKQQIDLIIRKANK